MSRPRSRAYVARLLVLVALVVVPVYALDGATSRVTPYNSWKTIEIITAGDDPAGDGVSYAMPTTFDGAGAYLESADTLRIQVNHETSDASVSDVLIDVNALRTAVANVRSSGTTGGVSFVRGARQAYQRWSSNGGSSFTNTSSASNTSFSRFCSSQSYAADTFGVDRGFVDPLYITGEETSGGRLFAIDTVAREFYQLSGVTGSAPGGTGGMPFDSFENAALIDTGETEHVALLLSPDGGTQRMMLYVGVKGRATNGSASTSFLARNGLAYGSWYYLNASLPNLGSTVSGSFDTTSAGSLTSTKLEDIDTSPVDPTMVVLGDQDSGVFVLDFALGFSAGSFSAAGSSFTLTKVANTVSGTNSLDSPDNVEWTAATTLGGTSYPSGLVFVNEDNGSGEIWQMSPDGSNKVRIGATTTGAESTGIFDLSSFLGYAPGSLLLSNNQGTPASMTLLVNPNAELLAGACGNGVCGMGENAGNCLVDCPTSCGDGYCVGVETTASCASDCPATCGDTTCSPGETPANCSSDCPTTCGDGFCVGVETPATCATDCPTTCGDGFCVGVETPAVCGADCASICGDTLCTGAEGPATCLVDCPTACGDAVCAGGESPVSCAADCPTTCGDGACAGNETTSSCVADCPPGCGDGTCDTSETQTSCTADCPAVCGDSSCSSGEHPGSCLVDCPTTCGDGYCVDTETPATCAIDCPGVCGDDLCGSGETPATCSDDCAPVCGDGLCSDGESACTSDCGDAPASAAAGCGCHVAGATPTQHVGGSAGWLLALAVLAASRAGRRPRRENVELR